MTDIEYLKKYLDKDKLEDGLKRLQSGEPVQYIIGNVDFYGNIINVNKNVLIPRFETELLVDKTIKYLKKYFNQDNEKINILDLATGSGNIAISLKKNLCSCVTATDISEDALKVARQNAKNNNAMIDFYQSDMLKNVKGTFDCIISNPPYIAFDEEVEEIVKNNEPHIALYAENNGLKYYEDILSGAGKHLNKKAIIAFEIGRTQGDRIKAIARKYFKNAKVSVEKDFTGNDRFVFVFINI